jgi:hypothetical protein
VLSCVAGGERRESMKKKARKIECPTRCNGRDRVRQILPGEFEAIEKEIKQKRLAPIGFDQEGVYRCYYCGCVFVRFSLVKLGFYNAPMIGLGWHPTP